MHQALGADGGCHVGPVSGGLQPSRGDRQANRPSQHSSGSHRGSQPCPIELVRNERSRALPRLTGPGAEGGVQHVGFNKPPGDANAHSSLRSIRTQCEKCFCGKAEAWRPAALPGSKPHSPLFARTARLLLPPCCSPVCLHFYQGCHDCCTAKSSFRAQLLCHLPKRPFPTTCCSPSRHPVLPSSQHCVL